MSLTLLPPGLRVALVISSYFLHLTRGSFPINYYCCCTGTTMLSLSDLSTDSVNYTADPLRIFWIDGFCRKFFFDFWLLD